MRKYRIIANPTKDGIIYYPQYKKYFFWNHILDKFNNIRFAIDEKEALNILLDFKLTNEKPKMIKKEVRYYNKHLSLSSIEDEYFENTID